MYTGPPTDCDYLAAASVEQARKRPRSTEQPSEDAQSAAHFKKMYDRTSNLAKIGVWECELATAELTWTDAVYDLFEIPRGSPLVRAETVALYEPASAREMERLRAEAIEKGSGFTLDIRVFSAKGNERWIRLTADVEQENGRSVRIFGTKQDITQERRAQDKVRALQAELIHLSRQSAMSTMASTIAHELNQPLAAIGNYMASARRLAAQGDIAPELSHCIDSVGKLTLRTGEVIRRLRDLTGRHRSQKTTFDVETLVREAVGLATARFPGATVTYAVEQGATIRADRIQIQQVLINLVQNSCEAADRDRCEVEIRTQASDGWLEVCVSDTGPGIPAALLPDVFETSLTTKPQASGIGLSICRTIIEAHGGNIAAANRIGGGASVSFRLPAA